MINERIMQVEWLRGVAAALVHLLKDSDKSPWEMAPLFLSGNDDLPSWFGTLPNDIDKRILDQFVDEGLEDLLPCPYREAERLRQVLTKGDLTMSDRTVDWEQLCRDFVLMHRAHCVAVVNLGFVRRQAQEKMWIDLDANELVDQAERIELDARHRQRWALRRIAKAVDSQEGE